MPDFLAKYPLVRWIVPVLSAMFLAAWTEGVIPATLAKILCAGLVAGHILNQEVAYRTPVSTPVSVEGST